MKRVCFLMSSAATSGGIQRSVSLITKGLVEKDYSISITSIFNYEKTFYDFSDDIIFHKGKLKSDVDLKRKILKAYREVSKLLSNEQFDVLVIEGLGLVPFVKKKYLTEKKIIVVDHTGKQNFSRFGLSNLGLFLTKKYADNLVVLTQKNFIEYTDYFLNTNCKVKLIPNPLDQKIEHQPHNSVSRKICFVGRLSDEKGPDLLIEAVALLNKRQDFNNWTLDIYGSGPEINNLRNQISYNNLEDKITLKGHKKDIYKLYSKYSFLVVPSRFESFGLVIIEAMKSGLPVVSFDAPYGPGQLIKHGVNGLLVERENVEGLANSMCQLMSSSIFREKLSSNTDYILEKFEFQNIIDNWVKMIGD